MAGEISAYAPVYVCLYVFFTFVNIDLHVHRCYAECLEKKVLQNPDHTYI